jgi:putative membrane protein
MSGWGYVLMSVSVVLFWALVIAGVVALVRYLSRSSQHTPGPGAARPTPEQVLAERYARGDIDDEEYRRRATGTPSTRSAPGSAPASRPQRLRLNHSSIRIVSSDNIPVRGRPPAEQRDLRTTVARAPPPAWPAGSFDSVLVAAMHPR